MLLALFLGAGSSLTSGASFANELPTAQNATAPRKALQLDPLRNPTKSFPRTLDLKQNGRLLEFCPDNTCDGFVSSRDVSVATLKDFAYLYIYFFSDFSYLSEWRTHSVAKDAATRVLYKAAYRECKSGSDREAARGVLLSLSRGGKIKRIFVRYGENRRNVAPEDISKEVSKKSASTR
jgi:hypothetical protein